LSELATITWWSLSESMGSVRLTLSRPVRNKVNATLVPGGALP